MALVIKYNPNADTGVRPLPPGTVFWTNQSIRLLHPSDTTIDDATTKQGVPTTVQVRVSNVGQNNVSDVRVEAYVFKVGTAFTPATALVGPFTGTIVGPITPTNSGVVECKIGGNPWNPQAQQAGHCCVCANTWLDDGSEGVQLGSADPFQVTTNPRHGQRNITVVALQMSREGHQVKFALWAANPDGESEGEFVLVVSERRGRTAIGRAERALIRSGPHAEVEPRLSRLKTRRLGLAGEGIKEGVQEAQLQLRPGEERELALLAELSPAERIGGVHVFDVVQLSRRRQVLGGLRLVTLVVPE
jgi:hypothetical protein